MSYEQSLPWWSMEVLAGRRDGLARTMDTLASTVARLIPGGTR